MKHLQRALAVTLIAIALTIFLSPKEYAASPSANLISFADTDATVNDYRVRALRDYLNQYDSPLAPYAQKLVGEADANGIDWKLLAAISGVESTFAQAIPNNSYNAWGWGIYGDQTKRFGSWDEAISTISKGLKENYINKLGTDDVYSIGRIYAASPTWAQRVDRFMEKIDTFSNHPSYALSLSI